MSPLFPLIQSDLDLNGPILSFNTQPVGTSCSVASGIATFIGIATATFPASQTERETNTGTVTHQWYSGTTALSDGTTSGVTITGSATTTLTLSGLTSPLPISGQVFVQAGYDPDDLSPNAINEPINSDDATLTVFPTISIDTQPTSTSVVEDIPTTFSVVASTSDSSTGLGYQWYLNSNEISGETSSTLSITRPDPGQDKVYCEVSHPTAQPGIVTTTEVNLDVASSRAYITWELIGAGTRQGKGERNIATAGPFTTRARANINARILQVFSPEKDLDVKITLGGAAGGTRGNNRGGEGGISVFKMTLKKNTEYTVKLGVNSYAGGGPRGGNNGGGGLAVIYEKAKVIAVCGGGGGAGTNGRGGFGGGINVGGSGGLGAGNGTGGGRFEEGNIPADGLFGSASSLTAVPPDSDTPPNESAGGRTIACTRGVYWRNQGVSACADVGTTQFRLSDGTIVTNTSSSVTRGFKDGYNIIQTKGVGVRGGGAGGSGAEGGQGATNSQGGGGGGSGYTDGSVTVIDTQQGGSEGEAKVILRVVPAAPEAVVFTQSRSSNENLQVVLTLESGTGPTTITFGSSPGFTGTLPSTVTAQIQQGTIYNVSSTNGVDERNLSGSTLTFLDNDITPGSLSITPSKGEWVSTTRYQFL